LRAFRECAKPDQGDAIAFFQGAGDAIYGGVNRSGGLSLAHAAARCDPVNEISFIHFSSWGGFLFLSDFSPSADALPSLSVETRRKLFSSSISRMSTVKIRARCRIW
jgi:hypothetical protein